MRELIPHLPRLRRYARALTGEHYAADDLVQDTLVRAMSRFGLLKRPDGLESWLLSIMHNLFVNQVRSAAARTTHNTSNDELDERQSNHQSDPSLGLSVRDLDTALQKLPPAHREVILLVGLENLSYAETADVLRVPVGTVMSRLARAREHLRTLLAGEPSAVAHLKVVTNPARTNDARLP